MDWKDREELRGSGSAIGDDLWGDLYMSSMSTTWRHSYIDRRRTHLIHAGAVARSCRISAGILCKKIPLRIRQGSRGIVETIKQSWRTWSCKNSRFLPILKILQDRKWSKRFLKESGKPERIIATLELFQRILKKSCKNPEKSLKNVKMKKFLSILTILKDRKWSKRIRKSWNPVRILKTQRSWKNPKNPR